MCYISIIISDFISMETLSPHEAEAQKFAAKLAGKNSRTESLTGDLESVRAQGGEFQGIQDELEAEKKKQRLRELQEERDGLRGQEVERRIAGDVNSADELAEEIADIDRDMEEIRASLDSN